MNFLKVVGTIIIALYLNAAMAEEIEPVKNLNSVDWTFLCIYYHNGVSYDEVLQTHPNCPEPAEPESHSKMTEEELKKHAPDCVIDDEVIIKDEPYI